MADVTAQMVKALRDKSGAGMMDAKKALVENGGDMEASVDWLRTKGLAKADKKVGRTAAEGLVAVATSGSKGVVVEINSETDFVARNADFQAFVAKTAELALDTTDTEALVAATKGEITEMVATIGEQMNMRRMAKLEVSEGVVVPYVHGALAEGMGKIGVLVALESSAEEAVLTSLGKQLAMHVAAANPASLDRDSIDEAVVEREKAVLFAEARESGKPEEIIEKMLTGRMNKFFAESCMLEQVFVIDGESKVADFIANVGKEAGAEIKLVGYERFQLGDGIEVVEEDYAAEVAKLANA